ncbi:pentatricopeptide repeat-containing protein At3g02650, mitochondrial-like [Zingiber officinale]|uniref:pentatricopeptide repeat-containing protein At3g02650, mitochondrial-like n=1 Tax=Zingiber officinale TaxID=94328 RepID=UPI001C4C845B|nr:pentatricopeptide repeat-containing protein At3g02650, mitochondrial-like [Zingiber officinale]
MWRPLIRRSSPIYSTQVCLQTLPLIPPPPSSPAWIRPVDARLPTLRFFSSSEMEMGMGIKTDEHCEADESVTRLWKANIDDDDTSDIFADEKFEETAETECDVDLEQVEKVRSLVGGTSQDSLETRLDQIDVTLSAELVALVLQTPDVLPQNLINFFIWAWKSEEETVRSSRTVEILVDAVSGSTELSKMEAYKLWDLVKEIGKNNAVLLNTSILNQLISLFGRLQKPRAGLEVFNKFSDFGCSPDRNTYCLTIAALGTRSLFNTAWPVCEKMLTSEDLPDGENIGKIITFLCKGKKAKEAHLVYLMAQQKEMLLPSSCLDILVRSLSRKEETLHMALELLNNYPKEYVRNANAIFALVIQGLCRAKQPQEAKKLLFRMVQSGPPPGTAVFNYVITALSKGGEMEDAISLMNLIKERGLQPDIYTYSVIMSGFAEGGLMDEAYQIYREAKKKHSKLSPVTYHIIIRGYCKMEEYEKALKCLKEMKEDGVQPNSDEYNKLIRSLCLKALDWRTAEKLLEEMKESGLFLKDATRSLILAVKELEEEAKSESVGDEV